MMPYPIPGNLIALHVAQSAIYKVNPDGIFPLSMIDALVLQAWVPLIKCKMLKGSFGLFLNLSRKSAKLVPEIISEADLQSLVPPSILLRVLLR
jgi:hypothetical protein